MSEKEIEKRMALQDELLPLLSELEHSEGSAVHQVIDAFHKPVAELEAWRDELKAKRDKRQADLVEGGMVALVISGMDCDGVEWSNDVTIVPELVADMREANEYAWADGPIDIVRMAPSEAMKLEYHSRDRVAAAHEDGHPWSI